ncbi:MAG TPA: hypothetical protein VF905_02685 [Nitrospirota bacterium]
MSTRARKWSSVLLIISGLLLAVPILFHPDVTKPGYALLSAWVPVHVLLGLSALIGVAGLIVFYGAVSPKTTVVGHVAFWFAIIGTVLMVGLMFFVEAAIVPVLSGSTAYEPLLSMSGPIMAGTFGVFTLITAVIIAVGYILFGGYLIGAKIISPTNGILFIIGAPLIAFSPPWPNVVMIIGGVLFGIALIWLGVSIRSGRAHDTLESTLRIHDECLAQAGGHA